jgi:hypothetical protein
MNRQRIFGVWVAAAALILPVSGQGEPARPSIQELRARFEHPIPDVRWKAAAALASYGKQALPIVEKALVHDAPEVRRAALDAVVALKAVAAPLRPSVEKLLLDRDAWVRSGAADAMGGFGELPEKSILALIERAADPDLFVRVSAMQTLAKRRVTQDKKLLLRAACACLEVEETGWSAKRFAMDILRRHGKGQRAAIPSMLVAMRMAPEGMWDGTEQLARLLIDMGKKKEVLSILSTRLDSPEKGGYKTCMRVIGKLGKDALSLRPRIEEISRKSPDRDRRRNAKQVLEQLDMAAKAK